MITRRGKQQQPDALPPTAGLKVLVVDDDTYVRLLCSLELPEVQVLEATTIDDAIDVAVAQLPHIVLVDIHLHRADGLDLVRRLRAESRTSSVPIIVITAGHDEQQRSEVVRAGADGYLAKPLDADVLRSHIAELCAMDAEERWARRTEQLSQ